MGFCGVEKRFNTDHQRSGWPMAPGQGVCLALAADSLGPVTKSAAALCRNAQETLALCERLEPVSDAMTCVGNRSSG